MPESVTPAERGEPPAGLYARVVKPAADRAGAAVLLCLLAPVLAAVAVAVKLDSGGPVFFTQPRLGRDGRPFRMVKFRTMRPGAPPEFLPDGSTLVRPGDDRITRAGHFLRRTSLDELPQLLNVLRGDMSLIGPRPDLVEQERLYDEHTRGKLAVRPGITGLAQVSGRNAIPSSERLRLDAEYARSVSLRRDLAIAARTLRVIAGREGIDPGADPGDPGAPGAPAKAPRE
jgi:lipopolysaccharide/colanic/teichoic acid biosynthesis glycosyltransferase